MSRVSIVLDISVGGQAASFRIGDQNFRRLLLGERQLLFPRRIALL